MILGQDDEGPVGSDGSVGSDASGHVVWPGCSRWSDLVACDLARTVRSERTWQMAVRSFCCAPSPYRTIVVA